MLDQALIVDLNPIVNDIRMQVGRPDDFGHPLNQHRISADENLALLRKRCHTVVRPIIERLGLDAHGDVGRALNRVFVRSVSISEDEWTQKGRAERFGKLWEAWDDLLRFTGEGRLRASVELYDDLT